MSQNNEQNAQQKESDSSSSWFSSYSKSLFDTLTPQIVKNQLQHYSDQIFTTVSNSIGTNTGQHKDDQTLDDAFHNFDIFLNDDYDSQLFDFFSQQPQTRQHTTDQLLIHQLSSASLNPRQNSHASPSAQHNSRFHISHLNTIQQQRNKLWPLRAQLPYSWFSNVETILHSNPIMRQIYPSSSLFSSEPPNIPLVALSTIQEEIPTNEEQLQRILSDTQQEQEQQQTATFTAATMLHDSLVKILISMLNEPSTIIEYGNIQNEMKTNPCMQIFIQRPVFRQKAKNELGLIWTSQLYPYIDVFLHCAGQYPNNHPSSQLRAKSQPSIRPISPADQYNNYSNTNTPPQELSTSISPTNPTLQSASTSPRRKLHKLNNNITSISSPSQLSTLLSAATDQTENDSDLNSRCFPSPTIIKQGRDSAHQIYGFFGNNGGLLMGFEPFSSSSPSTSPTFEPNNNEQLPMSEYALKQTSTLRTNHDSDMLAALDISLTTPSFTSNPSTYTPIGRNLLSAQGSEDIDSMFAHNSSDGDNDDDDDNFGGNHFISTLTDPNMVYDTMDDLNHDGNHARPDVATNSDTIKFFTSKHQNKIMLQNTNITNIDDYLTNQQQTIQTQQQAPNTSKKEPQHIIHLTKNNQDGNSPNTAPSTESSWFSGFTTNILSLANQYLDQVGQYSGTSLSPPSSINAVSPSEFESMLYGHDNTHAMGEFNRNNSSRNQPLTDFNPTILIQEIDSDGEQFAVKQLVQNEQISSQHRHARKYLVQFETTQGNSGLGSGNGNVSASIMTEEIIIPHTITNRRFYMQMLQNEETEHKTRTTKSFLEKLAEANTTDNVSPANQTTSKLTERDINELFKRNTGSKRRFAAQSQTSSAIDEAFTLNYPHNFDHLHHVIKVDEYDEILSDCSQGWSFSEFSSSDEDELSHDDESSYQHHIIMNRSGTNVSSMDDTSSPANFNSNMFTPKLSLTPSSSTHRPRQLETGLNSTTDLFSTPTIAPPLSSNVPSSALVPTSNTPHLSPFGTNLSTPSNCQSKSTNKPKHLTQRAAKHQRTTPVLPLDPHAPPVSLLPTDSTPFASTCTTNPFPPLFPNIPASSSSTKPRRSSSTHQLSKQVDSNVIVQLAPLPIVISTVPTLNETRPSSPNNSTLNSDGFIISTLSRYVSTLFTIQPPNKTKSTTASNLTNISLISTNSTQQPSNNSNKNTTSHMAYFPTLFSSALVHYNKPVTSSLSLSPSLISSPNSDLTQTSSHHISLETLPPTTAPTSSLPSSRANISSAMSTDSILSSTSQRDQQLQQDWFGQVQDIFSRNSVLQSLSISPINAMQHFYDTCCDAFFAQLSADISHGTTLYDQALPRNANKPVLPHGEYNPEQYLESLVMKVELQKKHIQKSAPPLHIAPHPSITTTTSISSQPPTAASMFNKFNQELQQTTHNPIQDSLQLKNDQNIHFTPVYRDAHRDHDDHSSNDDFEYHNNGPTTPLYSRFDSNDQFIEHGNVLLSQSNQAFLPAPPISLSFITPPQYKLSSVASTITTPVSPELSIYSQNIRPAQQQQRFVDQVCHLLGMQFDHNLEPLLNDFYLTGMSTLQVIQTEADSEQGQNLLLSLLDLHNNDGLPHNSGISSHERIGFPRSREVSPTPCKLLTNGPNHMHE